MTTKHRQMVVVFGLWLLAIVSCLASAAMAATEERHVKLRLLADTTAIVPGKPFRLGAVLDMDPGWHTYYKEPGEAGMPTRITWKLPEGFKASELLWQQPHKFTDAGIITYGYQDQTIVGTLISAPADIKPNSTLTMTAEVSWLSCKEICLPGKGTVSISLPVQATAEPANTALFSTLDKDVSDPAVKTATQNTFQGNILDADLKVADEPQMGLLAYLGLAFIGGFILNFMPCVLPVISIKVISFMQQAGDDPKRVFKLGLTFTAGIVSSFLVLAGLVVAIQAAGQKIGWGFQFQFPLFLFSMAAIVLLFALSLFGLFYIQLGGTHGEIDKLAQKEGYVGTFFKGVLATVLSTPCSAPFLGTALGFAFSQQASIIFLIFLSIALGMAFPYVLLTAQPAWMRYLPKPGVWMEKFKEAMGFLLLATTVWLIWVLGKQVGVTASMAAVAFLICLAFAAWLIGRFIDLRSTNLRKTVVCSVALLTLVGGYIGFVAPFPQLLSTTGYSTEAADPSAPPVVLTSNTDNQAEGIDWRPFSITALNESLAKCDTVFVDFTADWCLTCKANETTVLNTPPVIERIKALKVVAYKADWTRQDPTISQLLKKFGRSGVPLYVVFPGGDPTHPIVLPEAITQQLVIDKLNAAAGK